MVTHTKTEAGPENHSSGFGGVNSIGSLAGGNDSNSSVAALPALVA